MGITLVANVQGTTLEFFGALGLTPRWLDKPLDRKGKGWISACLFARVNGHDVPEPVSLRGPHPALTVSGDEAAQYPVQEGAFYGNVFTPANQPINWIACQGEGQASGELGGLVDRDCAEPDPAYPTHTQCGFKFVGDCADFTPTSPSPSRNTPRRSVRTCRRASRPASAAPRRSSSASRVPTERA